MKKRFTFLGQRIIILEDSAVLTRKNEQSRLLFLAERLILKEPVKAEQKILELFKNPDTFVDYGAYFMLARCQESLGQDKEALENYRLMFNKQGNNHSSTDFLNMGYYALCAIRNRRYGDFLPAMTKAIDKFYDLGRGEKYLQSIPVTGDVDIMKAYASYILSMSIINDPLLNFVTYDKKPYSKELENEKRYAMQIEQENFYLQQAVDLGRGTVPGAYIQLAKVQLLQNKAAQAEKTLNTFLAKYAKRYPEIAEDAKALRKTFYVPTNAPK